MDLERTVLERGYKNVVKKRKKMKLAIVALIKDSEYMLHVCKGTYK